MSGQSWRNAHIAFFKDPSHSTWFTLAREKCEANARDPNFKTHMTLGLPRSQQHFELEDFKAPNKQTKLKTFLDEE